ncbi:LOW QUALITY PROTEIN: ras GTPase-activating protein-binding protein 2-like [Liolophura sinensis]|uniref:LOW QUALITY PROTEIN: ras GTPase-activating protein-binding protein 2-like n=1 Tax=Liolophura sinensis TaxID=3198878 RepID=UPI0031591051
MVMETPSPQCVGREFVRQYYTLLHEAPLHLHRFYSHNSSFVHGGVEKPGEEQPPVTGQANIHKKIVSLNFRDCPCEDRQVDSHATVDNAVVLQVTGELSNNGQPMRRFMQTFVLAPQYPKKYYVHNDIFRYQDEVFHDTDSDAETRRMWLKHRRPNTRRRLTQRGTMPAYFENTQPLREALGIHLNEKQENLTSGNGTAHLEEVTDSVSPKEEEDVVITKEEEVEVPEAGTVFFSPESKPFSWAAMASKNTAGAPAVQSTSPGSHAPVPVKAQPVRTEVKPDQGGPTPQPQRVPRPRNRDRERGSIGRNESEGDTDSQSGRRGSRYPDSHQLFVGNLPHNISEKELKDYFEKYGRVVELRINTKSGGGKVPNFGFVVFNSPDPVQTILSSKPIMYNGEHRLNVEEKKAKGEGGRPGSGRGGPGRGGPIGGGMTRGGFPTGPSGRGGPRPGGGGMGGRENRNNPGGGGGGRGISNSRR